MRSSEPRRSGCGVVSGVFFIALGSLLLAQNLTDFHIADYAREALGLFADYWPVLLILWGAYKLYERYRAPERSRVGALEVLALVLVASAGIAVGATERLLDRLARSELRDELGAVLGPDVLGRAHLFEEEASFDLVPGAPLVVENRLGGLRARGSERDDLRVVLGKRVIGTSEGEARRIAEDVRFELLDGTAKVTADRDVGAGVDVELYLPHGTPLTSHTEDGRVSIGALDAAVEVETSDGDVELERLGGSVSLRTRHGDVRLHRVSGDATVESRRGSIVARRLGAGLRAQTARETIAVEEIEGDVVLANRSGSIHAARVGGRVEIRAHRTRVEVEAAAGAVDIASSDRPVFVRGVGESLVVAADNAPLEVREVAGDAVLENRLQPVRAAEISGSLILRSPNGSVVAERISGPVTIEGTSEDVRVAEFGSTLTVKTSHGSIVASTSELSGEIVLESAYGDIDLSLPEDASFRLVAESRNGDLSSALESLDLGSREDEGGVRRWRGRAGSGDAIAVRLSTDHGDIRLRPSER